MVPENWIPCRNPLHDYYGKFRLSYFRDKVRNTLNPDNDPNVDYIGLGSRKITCYENLELPGAPGVSGHYFPASHYQPENTIVLQAAGNITTTQPIRVYAGADYRFKAGGVIDIGPGFEAEQGATVIMEIEECSAGKAPNPRQELLDRLNSIPIPTYKKLDVAALSGGTLFENSTAPALVMQAFPNPASGTFKVQFAQADNYSIVITNTLGQTVYSTRLSMAVEKEITLGHSSGVLYITATDSKGNNLTGKIWMQP
jgi:hypothetical protein